MLPNFSVRRPYTVVVAVLIIAILGAVSLADMTTDLFPSMDLPVSIVNTTYVGASPEEVEERVTRPIEQSMLTLSNIRKVSSISRENSSTVILEFAETANMDTAMIEMRENLDMVTSGMPDEVGNPMMIKLNPDMMPVMVLSVTVEGQTVSEASGFIENTIMPELESVEGVASVSASGLADTEIHVTLQEDKIDEVNERIQEELLGMAPAGAEAETGESLSPPLNDGANPEPEGINITKDMVSGILAGQNFSMPAGYLSDDGADYLVRTGDALADLDELKQLVIMTAPVEGMEPIVLEDVAEIAEWDSTGETYSKVNGNDSIILNIQKQTEYSTSEVAGEVHLRMDRLMEENQGLNLIPLMDQGEYIDMVVNSMGLNLIVGGILAVLILFIFLRDIKPTIVVGFAIPISIVTAFVLMYFSNVSLNVISMGGLALGVGMLVDNSIVVIENIYRMRSEGKAPKEAAVAGAKQVAGAIAASTLTTISVFVPILFTEGLTRQIFSDMGLTIAYALLASLLIALTLVPMIASNLMTEDRKREHRVLDAIKVRYTGALEFSLNRKWLVVLTALLLFVGSIAGAVGMGTELFPAGDTGQLNVNASLPEGTSFDEAAEKADQLTEIISGINDVETVGTTFGGGGMMGMGGMMGGRATGGTIESISMYVLLKDDHQLSIGEVAQVIRDRTGELELEISVDDSSADMMAMSGGSIVVNITGRDLDTLQAVAEDLAGIVSEVEGTTDISDGLERAAPELRVVVDKEKSISHGLTVAQVFERVNRALQEDGAATTLTVGSRDYEVFVKADDAVDFTREDLEGLTLESQQGGEIPLTEIAGLEEASGFTSINRTNQQRYLSVSAEVAGGYNIGLVGDKIEDRLNSYQLPEGYSTSMGGEIEMIADSFSDLFLMLALGVILIYLVMVAQFQSLLSPFIIMFTIPLAFTGGFLALIITGYPVSMVAFIGLIILSGVVVNNGIVFVDYINKLREAGMRKREAIIRAGNVRLRPIIMTALTTIFALSTMSLGMGMGTEMIQPMAITAIGGLIYATALTLLLVPILYDAFNRKEKRTPVEQEPGSQ